MGFGTRGFFTPSSIPMSTNGLACWFGALPVVWVPRIGVRARRLGCQSLSAFGDSRNPSYRAPNQQAKPLADNFWMKKTVSRSTPWIAKLPRVEETKDRKKWSNCVCYVSYQNICTRLKQHRTPLSIACITWNTIAY